MKKLYFILLLFAAVLVHVTALLNNYLFNESAIYAQIAYNCVSNDDYINLILNGADWLGKPHLSFWIRSLFINLFGYSVFTYKLPSFLFLLLSVVYTYYLSNSFYDKKTAQISTLIYISSAQLFVASIYANNEVIVICLTLAAVYHINKVLNQYTELHLILAGVFSGLLVICNGLLLLLFIYLAIGLYIYINKNKLKLEEVPWFFLAIATLLFILPEIYSLYVQYDLYPDKYFGGHNNISGIKYFLFDDPFGQFLGLGINTSKLDSQTLFFFIHSLLWCFSPWICVGCLALFVQGKRIYNHKVVREQLSFWCFTVLFLFCLIIQFHFSLYIGIIIPFYSILISNWFVRFFNRMPKFKERKVLKLVLVHFYPIFFLISIILLEIFFQTKYPYYSFISASIIIGFIMVLFLIDLKHKYIPFLYNYVSVLAFFLFVSMGVYPTLSGYHSGIHAANYCNERFLRHKVISTESTPLFAQQLHKPVKYVKSVDEVKNIVNIQNETSKKATIIYTNINFVRELRKKKIDYTLIKSFLDYEGPLLNFTYLNRATRYKAVDLKYILQLD